MCPTCEPTLDDARAEIASLRAPGQVYRDCTAARLKGWASRACCEAVRAGLLELVDSLTAPRPPHVPGSSTRPWS